MAVSDLAVRQAPATGRGYTLNDVDGLALFVSAKGAKSWQFRFCSSDSHGLRSGLAARWGPYPEISLKEARDRRDQDRALIAKGIDPRVHWFLCKLHRYRGGINTQLGLRLLLLLLTGVRTLELRSATPEQFNLESGLCITPSVIVKQSQVRQRKERKEISPYVVPLGHQAIAIVKYLLSATLVWRPANTFPFCPSMSHH